MALVKKKTNMNAKKREDISSGNDRGGLMQSIFPSKGNAYVFMTSVLLNLLLWLYIYIEFRPGNERLPLHYNVYRGVEIVDSWFHLFYLPILGLFFTVVNYMLSVLISPKDKLVAYFLNITSIVIQIIIFVALFWIFNLQKGLFEL